MENNDNMQGTCMDMCPKDEIKMREREKLVHVLEMVPGTEYSKFLKANRKLMVKSFSRSAAGKTLNKLENLRPPQVLLKTVSYLLFDVINNEVLPWHKVYDFITDRLLAVRQDMVIQNLSNIESIPILQPIVHFHAFAAYKLCEENLNNFDPILNNNHLQESLKRLLNFFDTYNNFLLKGNEYSELSKCYDYLLESRPEFEAMYIIFNLGNEEALIRSLHIPPNCKTKIVTDAVELSFSYKHGNFVRTCRLMKKLPFLLAALASLFLPEIRRKAFRVMSTAYSCKNLKFPVTTLKEILLYRSNSELLCDTTYYGIRSDDEYIYFSRKDYDPRIPTVHPKHEAFVEEKFIKEDLHTILFSI